MLRRFVVSFVVLSGISIGVQAQQPAAGTAVKIDGVINKVVPGQGIVVDGKDKKQYGVGFDNTSKVSLEGTAGPEAITVGSYVQYDVTLNDKQEPTGPVKKIQLIDKSPINQPGVFSALGPDGKPGAAGPYFVRGTVKTNKNNEVSVVAGSKTMNFTLDPTVSVPVFLDKWQWAKPGDTITGDGKSFPAQGTPFTPVLGTRIMIKSVGPIDMKKKR